MFLQYGWLDGMVGFEIKLPQNRFVSDVVYEYLKTTYQSGPLYHDHTEAIPDQISAGDNYYNHNLYCGWQHWGQAIGNPLLVRHSTTTPPTSPSHQIVSSRTTWPLQANLCPFSVTVCSTATNAVWAHTTPLFTVHTPHTTCY